MRLICAICLLAVCGFFAACGSKSQSDAVCDDSTQVTEDSVLQQMANEGPTEDEIAALTDSAKQEKPKALDEKYRGLHIYVSKRPCIFTCSMPMTAFCLIAALLVVCVVATNS